MTNTFILEVSNNNEFLGLLEGDEVLVSTFEQPRSNGKDLAAFGSILLVPSLDFGNQIMLLGERIRVG